MNNVKKLRRFRYNCEVGVNVRRGKRSEVSESSVLHGEINYTYCFRFRIVGGLPVTDMAEERSLGDFKKLLRSSYASHVKNCCKR